LSKPQTVQVYIVLICICAYSIPDWLQIGDLLEERE
jgi:hypothetical protein